MAKKSEPLERRIAKTDEAAEAQFGKPDYSKAFIKDGLWYIPMTKCPNLWRIEPLGSQPQEGE